MYCKKQKGKNGLKIGGIYSVDDKYLIIPITNDLQAVLQLDDVLKKYKKKIPSNELINIFVEDFFEDTEFKHFYQIYYNGYLGQLDKRNLNLIELNYQTIQEKKK